MENYRELERLKEVQNLIETYFSYFGKNKKNELIRLLYEISKKENISPHLIINENDKEKKNYNVIKKELLKRRYPLAFNEDLMNFYFPKIEFRENEFVQIKDNYFFYPKRIIVEESIKDSSIAKEFIRNFPKAEIREIDNWKKYLKEFKKGRINDYNKRVENVFIIKEKFDFIRGCPCSKGAVHCGYYILNLSFGCIYECTYCYLQEYTNVPGLIFAANIEDFLVSLAKIKKKIRIGTGEFTDSLMIDHITKYSEAIVQNLKNYKNIIFEFKTKSSNINNLLKMQGSDNIVIAWSLNPQNIIDENEFYTASLEERINSAKQCIDRGYKVSFHFDPIFYYEKWQKDYNSVLELLFSKINPQHIAWISLGTFRFKRELKKIIERRFPFNTILNEELVLDFDKKLRYPKKLRLQIYQWMFERIKKYSKELFIYLCMENLS